MRKPQGWLADLLRSGELHALARQCRDQHELEERLGVSDNAFQLARKKLRQAGVGFPNFEQLKAAAPTQFFDVDVSDFDEEAPTSPSGRFEPVADDSSRAGISNFSLTASEVTAKPEPQIPTVTESLAARRDRTHISDLKSQLKDALDALERCQFERDTAIGVLEIKENVEPIRVRETTSGLREATAVALASDWHIEERVDAAAVNGVNEFNLEIARRRCERYFAGLIYLIRYHQDHFSIRDLLLWLGGDLITGYLREENLEHNELPPVQAIATLHEWIEQGIRAVLAATDVEMRCVCNSGNHGRLTEKVRPSTREANSIEWLLYAMLARTFASEPRVSFTLPLGSQTYVQIYDWTGRFTHGDETKFGGGVGGIMIPIRKAIAKWQTVRHAHFTAMGHYHQEHFLRDLLVNGSLVGYGPYSLSIAAPFEEPRQSFLLIDKHRGITFPSTIWVEDRRLAA